MPKREMTSGMLTRDKGVLGGSITFFSGLKRRDVKFDPDGYWLWKGVLPRFEEFTLEDWKKNYDLKPPRCGTAFEVEIEL